MSTPDIAAEPATHAAGRTSIVKVAFASMIGTAVEWYDFFLYGSAAALVFGPLFFPDSEPSTATLLAFATFAVGFFARPLGGIVFGHYGDKLGRKKMLVVSLLMMGAATFAIGLLPTFASIGMAAPLLLIGCRLLQGFAVGGEWGGAVLMAAEHGDNDRRGFWTSWTQAGVPLGNLLSAVVLWVLALFQSDEAFDSWGWRIPFLLSAVLVLIGLWIRLSIEESPVFAENKKALENHKAEHAPIIEVLRKYPREVLIAMGLRLVENTSYYIFTVVVMTYMVTYLDMPKSAAIAGVLIASVAQFFLTPVIGALSDRVGRRPLYFTGALGAGIWGFVFFPLIDTGNQTVIAAAIFIGLIFTTLMYAPQAAMFSELFGTSVRYSGASLGYQLASVFAGGLAPVIAVALLGTVEEKNTIAVSIYLAVLAVITIIAVIAAKETARTSLVHDRVLDEATGN
ncbi:MFS transporter [Rhodococcus sp. ACPA1]|uniref:MFS transporter n=1 Tax=Rhodococcus sp. ACPA1 TaxID=2028572 RepID=UPI000BB105AB|nr:MFS transporter [Rhodococcus sp. ACPA1]PBC55760.1 MFS transporter [Rhodococcus sp. ACPA1]